MNHPLFILEDAPNPKVLVTKKSAKLPMHWKPDFNDMTAKEYKKLFDQTPLGTNWQELIDIVEGMIDRDTNRKGKNEHKESNRPRTLLSKKT